MIYSISISSPFLIMVIVFFKEIKGFSPNFGQIMTLGCHWGYELGGKERNQCCT
ncbi:hypothetical protein ACLOJK_026279, partial [Asimina triloba]